ncbi:MAG TPA: hypothetical protein VEJ68_00455, partial [Candidatus Bathyarchaeia archaeon]|nr:hypothetical protein [Candidatus Bathyarchaeia archaeon]
LREFGELNQTNLLSYCGLNLGKHRDILDSLEENGLIKKTRIQWKSKITVKYSITNKGRRFCKIILEPYENMFPRDKKYANSMSEYVI